ncbi:MAG: hypothetical protein ACKVZ0_17155 [Gemmatimonadales bacterium]
MTELTREDRRVNRKHVLVALNKETGSFGGDAAASRVKAFIADPTGASTVEFAYVGGLTLRRFYIDESKPNSAERQSLWQEVTHQLGRDGVANPGKWDGSTQVKTLQAIAEEA